MSDLNVQVQDIRNGPFLAELVQRVPHRGHVHHGTDWLQLEVQLLTKLKGTSFTGLTLLQRGNRDVGVLLHFAGRLTEAWLDELSGAQALARLRCDPTITGWSSLRVAHPVLVAASSLFGGPLTGAWTCPVDPLFEALLDSQPGTFSGTLVWTGTRPGVSVYHGGRLFTDSLRPDLVTPGSLLQFTAVAPSALDLLGVPAPVPEPTNLSVPLPVAPTTGLSPATLDDLWQATSEIYDRRLGRGAGPAIEKLQKQLAGQGAPAVRDAITERLKLAFGMQAVAAFEERLGEPS